MGLRLSNEHNIWSMAELEIYNTWGDKVSFEKKAKTLFKFGKTIDASNGNLHTVMQQLGTVEQETVLSTAAITHISSDDASASGHFRLEGMTLENNGNYKFQIQYPELDGTNKVELDFPLVESTRARKITTERRLDPTLNWTILASGKKIYVYEDDTIASVAGVPDTPAKCHLIMDGDRGTSFKASTAISWDDYYLITHAYIDIEEGQGTDKEINFEIWFEPFGGSPVSIFQRTERTTGNNEFFEIPTPIIIPKGCRVYMTVEGNAAIVTGGFGGRLALITEAAA